MDLTTHHPGQTPAALVERLGLQVTSVINNAGSAGFGPFHQTDPVRLRQEIAVDVTAVADITRAFIEQLRTAGRGVLVNVAGMAAYQPNPRMALYGATKAFVLSLTEACGRSRAAPVCGCRPSPPVPPEPSSSTSWGPSRQREGPNSPRPSTTSPPHWTAGSRRPASSPDA
ncbi:SDR family NAD(P)-dependent oxidoreductase [Streptomyces sp. NPDC019645]|uniref:SDR family NAD(P)-dependent oxidoreductase n=1 Tax=Streptomyces sp. NPDC019645 TaxID=3154786 RepID=UPI0033CE82E8